MTGEGDGVRNVTSKENVFRKQSLDQGFYITGFDGSLNVSKEIGLARETTSRGAEGRLTSGPATP